MAVHSCDIGRNCRNLPAPAHCRVARFCILKTGIWWNFWIKGLKFGQWNCFSLTKCQVFGIKIISIKKYKHLEYQQLHFLRNINDTWKNKQVKPNNNFLIENYVYCPNQTKLINLIKFKWTSLFHAARW